MARWPDHFRPREPNPCQRLILPTSTSGTRTLLDFELAQKPSLEVKING